jgi:GntR family transcriptional regulator
MSQSGRNGTPVYKKIQATILKRIESGQLRPGDSVDSERELARLHSVSLMTARHALAGLEREGMVERRRGSGTFVAPPKIHFNKLMSFTEQLASRGLVGCAKTLSCGVVEDEAEISARLALPSGSRLLKMERLRLGADEPFALETVYLSAHNFPELNRARLERSSLFSILDREYGITLVHADEEVDATSADSKTSELLSVPRGAPLLRIRQVIFSSTGEATLYVLGLYRSDRHTLMIRRFR